MWRDEAFAFTETSAFAVLHSLVDCSFDSAWDKASILRATDVRLLLSVFVSSMFGGALLFERGSVSIT
jgi:hypothetical protein